MSEPKRAVIGSGEIINVVLMDDETEQIFRDNGFVEMLWPGNELVNITGLNPQPGIGWSYDGQTFTAPEPQAPEVPADLSASPATPPIETA